MAHLIGDLDGVIARGLSFAVHSLKDPSTDAFGYAIGYHSLVAMVAELDLSDPRLLRGAAYAAYGWMPTILQRAPTDQECAGLWELIDQGRQLCDASAVNKIGAVEPRQEILTAVNDSVIGTSKLLHFAVPQFFPIWDSRIARSVGLKHRHQYNDTNAYLQYFGALHLWLSANKVPNDIMAALACRTHGTMVSPLRALEFALFLTAPQTEVLV